MYRVKREKQSRPKVWSSRTSAFSFLEGGVLEREVKGRLETDHSDEEECTK